MSDPRLYFSAFKTFKYETLKKIIIRTFNCFSVCPGSLKICKINKLILIWNQIKAEVQSIRAISKKQPGIYWASNGIFGISLRVQIVSWIERWIDVSSHHTRCEHLRARHKFPFKYVTECLEQEFTFKKSRVKEGVLRR